MTLGCVSGCAQRDLRVGEMVVINAGFERWRGGREGGDAVKKRVGHAVDD